MQLNIPPILRSRYGLLLVLLLTLTTLYYSLSSIPRGFVAYSTRPIWDHSEAPKDHLPHYYSQSLTNNSQLCQLHGWSQRQDQEVQVWDATIFSTELDLLLVRLHELDSTVTRFFILDSTHTFTGKPKPLILRRTLDEDPRFEKFRAKVVHETFQGHELEKGEDPFHQEGQQRLQMTSLLKRHLPSTSSIPIMIFSDLDEIPSRHTVELLRRCRFESPLHLGMRSFLYSFEWEEGGEAESWRAQATEWKEGGNGKEEYYRHGKVSERVLVDSGWHCSWCFRTLSEFSTKALGYSHVDRLGSRPQSLLRPERIQRTICQGSNLFNMLPESYDYVDFIKKLKLLPSSSAINLPSYIVEHAEDLKYLLPGRGNCIREDSPIKDLAS